VSQHGVPVPRKLKVLERMSVWLLIGLVLCGSIIAAGVLVLNGTIPDPRGNVLRGYTVTGLALGVLSTVLGYIAFYYVFRKRKTRGSGTMMTWLWIHITCSFVALVAAIVHAGFGSLSITTPSTGKLALLLFLLLTLSGIVWRLYYRFVPARAAPKIGNYSRASSAQRAEEQRVELEKLAAGKSPALRALKERLLNAVMGQAELAHAAQQIPGDEQPLLQRMSTLAASHHRALKRQKLQDKYSRKLQRWRILHVPLALLMPLLIAVHVVAALRVPARVLNPQKLPAPELGGFVPSKECKTCHTEIYKQWKRSMHSHALKSPVMIAQSNQVTREVLDDIDDPDPKLVCLNCHAPVAVLLTGRKQTELPFEKDGFDSDLLNEGIGCTTCHQFVGASKTSRAGLTEWQDDLDTVGDTYYGPFDDAVGNAYHRSEQAVLFDEEPSDLCRNCHEVTYDLDGDGKIIKGNDLVLQRTATEWDEYRAKGGVGTCVSCHMPVVPDKDDVAEGALLWAEQDGPAPERVVHDHSFVGVDYPIDQDEDKQRDKREALLQSAGFIKAKLADGKLTVSITNAGCGHNLPTGFAFARQMWLEVKGKNAAGKTVFRSGVLKNATKDLCDANTMSEKLMGPLVKGCKKGPDEQLVNFQQKLLDTVEIDEDKNGKKLKDKNKEFVLRATKGAQESAIQHLTAGVITRTRPSDGKKIAPIPPGDTRSFDYQLPEGIERAKVRLLFRSLPPYWLRAIAAEQKSEDGEPLEPMIENLQVFEMAKVKARNNGPLVSSAPNQDDEEEEDREEDDRDDRE